MERVLGYVFVAFLPVLVVLLWCLVWSPLYFAGGSEREAFYYVVFLPLILLYAGKAHVFLMVYWFILLCHFGIRSGVEQEENSEENQEDITNDKECERGK